MTSNWGSTFENGQKRMDGGIEVAVDLDVGGVEFLNEIQEKLLLSTGCYVPTSTIWYKLQNELK